MSKKLLVSIILLAVVVLVFVATRKPLPQVVKDTSTWSVEKADSIDEVVLEQSGKRLAFGKKDGEWAMTSPVESKAAQRALADVEALFAAGLKSDLIAEAPDDSYGFGEAALHVEVKSNGASVASFALGKQVTVPNSQARRAWLQPDGGTTAYRAYSLADSTDLSAALDRPLDDWREKKVLGLEKDTLETIELERDGQTVVVARGVGDDTWVITEPAGVPIDVGRASSLITTAENLLVDGFADAVTLDDAGLLAPSRTVTFKNADKSLVLEFGDLVDTKHSELAHGDTTARFMHIVGSGLIYTVSGYKVDTLTSSLAELRDKKVLDLDSDAIDKIAFGSPEEGLFTLVREGTQWTIWEGETSTVADPAKIGPVLANLSRMNAINFVDAPPLVPILDGKPNVLVVSLGQDLQHTLRFGASNSGTANTVLAQLDDGLIFELSSFVANALRKSATELRSE
ncbi:MAG: hypothetical protein AUK47_19340 [Deltaproteobacteria bacterium CG2_30_63_29]|nr:MAG: hypothetical protein AUK47_19340 [Deltaproteobacteria bacterium CG2_30_63_29]PIW02442.1 MAG: hypothetical protein COW42_01745 [Deltaproteobacteria bacterium CG17_big_fil_post_rev_8_21_14_2_50_63_7]PJB49125.1 MAG: hypothetical protein CO108_00900 [Deltaproteobacteria bacterium CG_4_9_14_3_um_filter_63_12]